MEPWLIQRIATILTITFRSKHHDEPMH